ncbi:MAG: TlpA family protein disulfide reductase [Candidatus Latescibacteria bacterium]|nr:TlpA family protein disulfide reductase [Candidatus Latescibacterota bacterium]
MNPIAKIDDGNLKMVMTVTCGALAALCVSLGVRFFGHPPGLRVDPLGGLLGTEVPHFEISGLDFGEVSPDSMGGDPYILYFTSTDCDACDSAYPILQNADSKIPLLIVGIGSRANLRKVIKAHGITAVVGYDSTRAALRSLGIYGVPSALFVDEAGIFRQAATGPENIFRMFSSFNVDK